MEPENQAPAGAQSQEIDALPLRITVEIGNKLVGGNAYGEAHAVGFYPLDGSGKVCRHALTLSTISMLTMLIQDALAQAVASGEAAPREDKTGGTTRFDA